MSLYFLQTHPAQAIVLFGGMLFLLGMAAWFDANGAEVPDPITVPYALLGIAGSFLFGRHTTGCIALLCLLAVLQPYRPKWLLALNEWLVHRAYGDEIEVEQETLMYSEQAEAFRGRVAARAERILMRAYISLPVAIIIAPHLDGWSANSILFAGFFCSAIAMYFIYLRGDTNNHDGPEGELPICAMGGADIIVFIGQLGLYGLIPLIYGFAVTFTGYLLFLGIKRLARPKDGSVKGTPLLPAVFFMAPARLALGVFVCPPVVDAFMWYITHNLF